MVLFTAIMGHNFSEEKILSAADFLNSIRSAVQPCLSVLHEHLISQGVQIQWQWAAGEGHSPYQDFQTKGIVFLDEKDMFYARISEHIFCLYCCSIIRWSEFLREPLANEGLRCLCKSLAKAFDSELIIYVPDSGGPPSGVSDLLYTRAEIEEAVIWLQTNCGPPAKTIEAIFPEGADVVNSNGYYIEFTK